MSFSSREGSTFEDGNASESGRIRDSNPFGGHNQNQNPFQGSAESELDSEDVFGIKPATKPHPRSRNTSNANTADAFNEEDEDDYYSESQSDHTASDTTGSQVSHNRQYNNERSQSAVPSSRSSASYTNTESYASSQVNRRMTSRQSESSAGSAPFNNSNARRQAVESDFVSDYIPTLTDNNGRSNRVPDSNYESSDQNSAVIPIRPRGFAASIRSYETDTKSRRSGTSRSFNSSKSQQQSTTARKPFMSQRLKGEVYKPWMDAPDPGNFWARIIFCGAIFIGLSISAAVSYTGYASVPHLGKLCLVLDDDFDTLDTSVWTQEIQLSGERMGFEWTTNKNTKVENGILYLVPTLTADDIGEANVLNDYTVNLTATETCTSPNINSTDCFARSNITTKQIINPVQSARLTTRLSRKIRYGKVSVTARMPAGDWLWPGIYMLPVNDTYGPYPASGGITLIESRGNPVGYGGDGVNFASSFLNWGPFLALDRFYLTQGKSEQRREYYNQVFRTFSLEWTDKYLWIYVDSRLSQTLALDFTKQDFWTRGNFPETYSNATVQLKPTNPWIQSDNKDAPFDQDFYLALSLGVGGTTGWFVDGIGQKPWIDSSDTAPNDFLDAKGLWYPTWSDDFRLKSFAIDSVKMWQSC